jgi:hypothetical protein
MFRLLENYKMKKNNIISEHIGESLLYFLSTKEQGSINDFKKAVQYLINKYELPDKVQNLDLNIWAEYLLDDLSSLLHIEFDQNSWTVSKPCLNILPGYSGKAILTGARTPELYKKIEASELILNHYLIDNSLTVFQEEFNKYARLNFFPMTIYISFDYEDIDSICEELNLNFVDTSAYEFLNCLPDLQEMLIKSPIIPDNSRSWVDLQIFDKFLLDKECGKLLECKRCNLSAFTAAHRNINENSIYRYRDFGNAWKYFIKINNNIHNISREVAIWHLLSENDLRHLYFDREPLPFGTLVMPLDFKLPLLYRKALTLSTGIVPYLYTHRQTNNITFRNNPMFLEYDNISKEFYKLLLKKIGFINTNGNPLANWLGYNFKNKKTSTSLDLCINTYNLYEENLHE